MNLVLIGFRGAGKSTVGRRIAGRLGREFIDTDDLVEKREVRSIREIVHTSGWNHFRAVEKKVIAELAAGDGLVIAPGGGAVVDQENVARLKRNGWMLWLKADPEVLLSRLDLGRADANRRPSLTGKGTLEELREVLGGRESLYEGAADVTIDTTKMSEDEVVTRILSLVSSREGI
jgi:shikimate kinase